MASTPPVYDTIGRAYARHRRPEPRIAAQVTLALGAARTVLNVGAGTGSYEPTDKSVVAVEPSPVMAAQRPVGAAAVVRAVAEHLPFPDGSFDAALAVLTIHHWSDVVGGLKRSGPCGATAGQYSPSTPWCTRRSGCSPTTYPR